MVMIQVQEHANRLAQPDVMNALIMVCHHAFRAMEVIFYSQILVQQYAR